jgi:hypothetical protein
VRVRSAPFAAVPRPALAPAACAPRRRLCRGQRVATRASLCASAAPALAAAGELAGSADEGCAQALFQLATLDPAGAAAVGAALGPVFSLATLLFIVRRVPCDAIGSVARPADARGARRIVMTWYPDIKDDAFPWIIVYAPTEPLLAPTRKFITPVGCDAVRRQSATALWLTRASRTAASTCRRLCGSRSPAS